MRIEIEIRLGNDAMQTGADVAGALRKLAKHIESYGSDDLIEPETIKHIMDSNGNCVGQMELTG